jgi:asparagine synthase (glutamine-hydrolysing)
MCGICGFLNTDADEKVITDSVMMMLNNMVHRGPDDSGVMCSGQCGIGMRRLSIIDLNSGKQPIHNEDASINVVCNGEIYNYRELRKDLEAYGHIFYTNSDTEVIVHSYEQFGESCLDKLRGMFAFALWDARERSIFLALDRFGIKPLYYAFTDSHLIFASELNAITKSNIINREIDYQALSQYLTYGYIPPPYSIFQHVRKLIPGHFLKWSLGRDLFIQKYWNPSLECSDRQLFPPVELNHHLCELLKETVKCHMVSDVPIGALLSGGIDSSALVALMSECSPEPIRTFSVRFADKAYDESSKAQLVASTFKTDHHTLTLEPENVNMLPEIIRHFGEPFADPAALPMYYVSKLARKHVKVVFSGDGADELFLGYKLFHGILLSDLVHQSPEFFRSTLSRFVSQYAPKCRLYNDLSVITRKRLSDALLEPRESYYSKATMIGISSIAPFLTEDIFQEICQQRPHEVFDAYLRPSSDQSGRSILRQIANCETFVSLPGRMLVKVDRMSMANSLEVRVPFVDHVLYEFASSLPIKLRMPNYRLKGLLKDAMRLRLPKRILCQRKKGFNVPLSHWIKGDLLTFERDILLSGECRRSGFFNVSAIEKWLKQSSHMDIGYGNLMWSLMVLAIWLSQSRD